MPTTVRTNLGQLILPPTPKIGSKNLFDYQQNVALWTRQCEQAMRQIERALTGLTTDQIPQGSGGSGLFWSQALFDAAFAAELPITVPEGGTGQTSFSAGRILYGNGTGTLSTDSRLVYNDTLNQLVLGTNMLVTLASGDIFISGTGTLEVAGGTYIDDTTPNTLLYVDSSNQVKSVTLTSPITLTSGTLNVPDFIASGASHARGLVPDPGAVAGSTKFLREDGTWAVPAGGSTPGDAAADGSTKGIATFLAADFNDNGAGLISLDYTNGQKASASVPGFLSSTDWSTFNSKIGLYSHIVILCAGFTPAATGADVAEIMIPYSPADGTTVLTWNVKRIFLRVGTAGGAPAMTVEKSTASGAFSATTVGTVTLGSGSYEGAVTSALGTVASGDKLRFNVGTLATAQNWTIGVEISNP